VHEYPSDRSRFVTPLTKTKSTQMESSVAAAIRLPRLPQALMQV